MNTFPFQTLQFYCKWKKADEEKEQEISWVATSDLMCYDIAISFINKVLPETSPQMKIMLKSALCYLDVKQKSMEKLYAPFNEIAAKVIGDIITEKTDGLCKEIAQLKDDKFYYKQKIDKKNEMIGKLKGDMRLHELASAANACLQNETLSADISKVRKENGNLLIDIDNLKRQIKDNEGLSTDIVNVRAENGNLLAEINKLKGQINGNEDLSADIAKVCEENGNLLGEIGNLKPQVKDNEDLQADIANVRAENGNLLTEINNLKDQIKGNEYLAADIAKVREENVKLSAQLVKVGEIIDLAKNLC